MTDLRKAAEMALDALGSAPVEFGVNDKSLHESFIDKVAQAHEALRQALAMEKFSEVNQELEQALAQPPADWEAVAADQAMTIAMSKIEKREWVGLTDEERFGEYAKYLTRNEWALVIESRLKEKNT